MARRGFLTGVVVGAGLVWFLDPERGAARRASARRSVRRFASEVESELGVQPEWSGSDWSVGTTQFRHDDLFGPEAAAERGPARLGRDRGRARRPPLRGALTGAAGGAIAIYGLRRRGVVGSAMRTVGSTILASGLREAAPGARQPERRRAVDAQRSVEVAASPERVYALWTDPANLPRFLGQVEQVEALGGGRWRWRVRDPRGAPIEWTTMLTRQEPASLLAWRTEPGAAVESAGLVRLQPTDKGTRVDVRVSYAPPPRVRGRAAAELLGPNPRRQLNDDLARMKALLDSGAAVGLHDSSGER
jgi:uncharacterized membrane protein